MIREFKKFIMRGNVLDLAIAMIMGGAFGKIVSSLVENIITPLLGIVLGGVNFSELSLNIGDAAITYGKFIQSIIDFLVIAISIFLFMKLINTVTEKIKTVATQIVPGAQPDEKVQETPPPATAPIPENNAVNNMENIEIYLKEIRDLLASQNDSGEPDKK